MLRLRDKEKMESVHGVCAEKVRPSSMGDANGTLHLMQGSELPPLPISDQSALLDFVHALCDRRAAEKLCLVVVCGAHPG